MFPLCNSASSIQLPAGEITGVQVKFSHCAKTAWSSLVAPSYHSHNLSSQSLSSPTHILPLPQSPLRARSTLSCFSSLAAALHGAIHKLTLKSPPTTSQLPLPRFYPQNAPPNSSDPQPMFFHCFQGYGHRRIHNWAWKDLGKPLTKTIWKPALRYSAHSSCVFKRSRT